VAGKNGPTGLLLKKGASREKKKKEFPFTPPKNLRKGKAEHQK